MITLPELLNNEVQSGNVVLFLGSGASLAAKDNQGQQLPTASDLARRLSNKFLGGKHATKPLSTVADLCLGGTSLFELESFLVEVFQNSKPSQAHLRIPTFSWPGIATTNYDLLIEDAYKTAKSLQTLHAATSDLDRATYKTAGHSNVELLKLHGSIDKAPNPNCPLILSVDQYVDHRKGRSTLFNRFEEWAGRYPVLFVGASLQDQDIVARLNSIPIEARLRCYLVAPDIDEIAVRAWSRKNVTAITGTFSQLMDALHSAIPAVKRNLSQFRLTSSHPIEHKFAVVGGQATMQMASDLANNLAYLTEGFSAPTVDGSEFFRGSYSPFEPATADLDVKRDQYESIMQSVLFADDATDERGTTTLLTGSAGSGKSVLLQRLALDLAREYQRIVFFLKPTADIPIETLCEVIQRTSEPVYLFVDNAGEHIESLGKLIRWAESARKPLHVLMGERSNEWYMASLDRSVNFTNRFDLKSLSNREAKGLIAKLAASNCLGHLASLKPEDQVRAITKSSGARGDLLVAIYQSTFGASLEDHIQNEFEDIKPQKAQDIYLTICALNRMNVMVRAGTIYRVHKVNFESFRQEFLLPLDKIVYDETDANQDIWYRARHSVVAAIVFDRVLGDDEERLNCLLRCLAGLDAGYESDRVALQKLTHHEQVKATLRSVDVGRRFYDGVVARFDDDPYLLQQAAVFELSNHAGDLQRAVGLVERARKLGPDIPAIRHTEAFLHLRLGKAARSKLLRDKEFDIAIKIAKELVSKGGSPFPYHTLASIAVQRLRDLLELEEVPDDSQVDGLIQMAESNIELGSTLFPDDSKLLETEADLAEILSDEPRIKASLERAILINPGRHTAAIALSRISARAGDINSTVQILDKALTAKPTSVPLRFALAVRLIERGDPTDNDRIRQLSQGCFGKNAPHPRAQLIYARQLFIAGDTSGARSTIEDLKKQGIAGGKRWRVYALPGTFSGRCESIDPYIGGRIKTDELGFVYLYVRDLPASLRSSIHQGTRCRFRVEFNSLGPIASDVQLQGS
ncbi:MAG: SIR2 family protein [Fimbriimonas sp.]|nr:SIR2 family protein [Fimbriimonas sp.]